MGSQPLDASSAECADVRADAEAHVETIRIALATLIGAPWATSDETAMAGDAALDALVASLTAARQERDEAREEARAAMDLTHIAKRDLHEVENRVDSMRGARDAARSCYRQSEATLEAARQREQQLTQALAEHEQAETKLCGKLVGAYWRDDADEDALAALDEFLTWFINKRDAAAAVLAGEAPPTAPSEP